MKEAIFRGVLIGGALGVMAVYFMEMSPPRAFALGLVAGFFAGLTKYQIEQRKSKKNR